MCLPLQACCILKVLGLRKCIVFHVSLENTASNCKAGDNGRLACAIQTRMQLTGLDAPQDYTREKSLDVPIEVETRTLKEVQEVLDLLESDPDCGVTRIMLDNMTRLDPTLPGEGSHVLFLCLM